MPRCTKRCCGVPVMSRPLKRIAPVEGASTPESRLKKVLLPAPLGPMIAVTLFGSKAAVTPSSATKPPKRRPMFSTARSGMLSGRPSRR